MDGSVKGGIWLLRGRSVHKVGGRSRERSIGCLVSLNHFQKGEVTSLISGHVSIRLVLMDRIHRDVNRGS